MQWGKLRENRYPADISIYTKEGMVLKEKGLLAVNEQGKILAFGNEAEEAMKNPYAGGILKSPFYQGRIFDYVSALALLKSLLKKCDCDKRKCKKWTGIMIPEGSNSIERKAIEDLQYRLHIRNLVIIEDKDEDIPLLFETPMILDHKIELLIKIGTDNPVMYAKEMAQDLLYYIEKNKLDKEEIIKILQEEK
ncbi:MAG: hypothetical protein HDT30_07075 [Clostridiales bacterium]|nr:hypothetical protein [Clostridiales bacterium]